LLERHLDCSTPDAAERKPRRIFLGAIAIAKWHSPAPQILPTPCN
jgi:hypothetical protein